MTLYTYIRINKFKDYLQIKNKVKVNNMMDYCC